MCSSNVIPQGRIRKKMQDIVNELAGKGSDKREIYKAICSIFPMMADEDVCWLDQLLGIAHLSDIQVGECVVDDVRICLGESEEDFAQDNGRLVEFCKGGRVQFGTCDKISSSTAFMAVAIKFANPSYGESCSIAKFNLVLEPEHTQTCEVLLEKDEYTKVVYFPVGNFFNNGYFSDETGVRKDFALKLCGVDSDETFFCKEFSYMGTPSSVSKVFSLLYNGDVERYMLYSGSELLFYDGNQYYDESQTLLRICLATSIFRECTPPETLQLAVRIDTSNVQFPEVKFMRYITLERYEKDLYMYEGNLFGELENLGRCMLVRGDYRISYMYMGQELFSSSVYSNGENEISLPDDEPCFNTVPELGEHYFYIPSDFETVEEGQDEGQEEEENQDFDWSSYYKEDYFQKFLIDQLDKELSLDSPGSCSVGVNDIRICSSESESDVGIIGKGWFLIRPNDKFIHLHINVESDGCDDVDVMVICRNDKGESVGELRRKVEKIGNGAIRLCIPVQRLCGENVEQGNRLDFEVTVSSNGEQVEQESFAGYAIRSIFDIVKLEHVALSKCTDGSLGEDPDLYTSFNSEELDDVFVQFGIRFPVEMKLERDDFRAQLLHPDGKKTITVVSCSGEDDGETMYSATFGKSDNFPWEKGRYELNVLLQDNKWKKDDIVKLTFEVGDWNQTGDFDAKNIMLAIKGECEEKVASPMMKFRNLIGLEEVKKEVENLQKQFELTRKRKEFGLPADMPFLHARFYGNPGTGKTTVAKLLGQVYKEAGLLSKGHVVFAERKTLIAGRWYDSVNKATMEAIDKAQGGILFIDEAYNLYVPDDGKDPGQDVISTLMTALSDESKKDWMLILAGYPLHMENMVNMNEGFASRVPNVFHFNDYNEKELMQIALKYCKDHVYTLTEKAKEQLELVISRAYSGRGRNFENARYVVNLMESVVLKRMGQRITGIENPTIETLTTILPEDIPSSRVIRESRKLQEFQKMVGLAELKESIQSHLNYVKLCNNRNMAGLESRMPSLHMVFSGNPGTGKTTVADFIGEIYASMGILSEGNVIKVFKKDLVGTKVGETERKVKDIFNRARGNVLFIDEAYTLNPNSNDGGTGKIVLDALVDELGNDKSDMIVILAGYPYEMEELLESNQGLKSRFPNVFHFEDYSVEELLKIAIEGSAAKDFVFTPTAKKRLEVFIRREVLKKQKSFGNGRFVSRLITNTILPRMATRLSGMESPSVKQLKTIVAEDIPITAKEAGEVNGSGFNEKLINDSLAKLDALVGLSKVKQAIHNFVDVARYRNSVGEKFVGAEILKWSFAGNTGTGKSTVAKIFADILKGMNLLAKGNFVEVKGEQIFNVSEYTCEQVLRSAVERSRYGMLFIDGDAPEFKKADTYPLTNEQLKIKLTGLTAENGGAGAIIMAECSAKREHLVSSMASNGIYEFDHTIVFDDYTPDELYQILAQCIAAHKVRFTPEAAAFIGKYIKAMNDDKGASLANARTMKLLSRTICEIVMLRESRMPDTPRRTVCLCDVEKFVWKTSVRKLGYRKL